MEDVENQSKPRGNPFSIEDLLDLPNEDPGMFASGEYENSHEPVPEFSCTDSSTVATLDTCINSVLHASETHFSGELICYGVADGDLSSEIGAPYGDLTDLEWLSNFVEESFSSEDIQNPNPLTSVPKSDSSSTDTQLFFHREPPVPGKARSKRSRTNPCNWSSLLSSSQEIFPAGKKASPAITGVRKCMHCETEKTPQWRMGPLGPKTLCNACGVRFKSGRLVPEYRPAASPTFVVSKHSNSHRKVVELRRKSEMQKSKFGGVAAGFAGEGLLIRRGFGED